jgi:hypothetical protein
LFSDEKISAEQFWTFATISARLRIFSHLAAKQMQMPRSIIEKLSRTATVTAITAATRMNTAQ